MTLLLKPEHTKTRTHSHRITPPGVTSQHKKITTKYLLAIPGRISDNINQL